ncbi:MAG: PEP-utilizing enzyme [Nanoarchaeota archaeon]
MIKMEKYQILVTSKGNIEGIVRDHKNFQKGNVLYIPNLEMNYLDQAINSCGIVSPKGGITAHMSTVCREYNIPVIVCKQAQSFIDKYIKFEGDEFYVYDKCKF